MTAMKNSNILAPAGNVHGNFQFVPDVSDIRHKILLPEIWKFKPAVVRCKWIPKT